MKNSFGLDKLWALNPSWPQTLHVRPCERIGRGSVYRAIESAGEARKNFS
jgi:hypothetical protein